MNGCPQGEATASRCQRSPAAQIDRIAKSSRAQSVVTTPPSPQPQLLTFELAPGLPGTIALNGQKIPQYHRGNSLSPCRTQLIHQQLTDRSSGLRSVATVAALDYRRMSVAVLQKPLSRHKCSLGHLRRTSQYTLVTTETSAKSLISSMRPRNKSLKLDWPGYSLTLFQGHCKLYNE